VEVLVDCPGVQEVFIYQVPSTLTVQPGDILSVPFGSQQVGAIAIRCLDQLPHDLNASQIKPVEAVIRTGFFPPTYGRLLNQIAEYYHTSLMQVIRVALPPGLLARSQRRIRLINRQESGNNGKEAESSFDFASLSLSAAAQQILELLTASKSGHYSWQYLQRQVAGANRGLQQLLQLGWVENYLEPPQPVRPKQRQAVTLVSGMGWENLPPRQQEVVKVLQRQGGEMWLGELLQQCHTSSATLKSLAQKGYLVMQPREVLRAEVGPTVVPDHPQQLTPDQANALAQIRQIQGFAQVLLHGVTGSGKTEVYLQAIAPLMQQGLSALVLVPEIGLTPQLTDRFRARFGEQICVYHSALSEGERYDTWRQMVTGEAIVVIGTRSAIFAPLPRLGLIILDEEHDPSFKQDQPAPCYHARTVAGWRAQLEQCPLILGSATPSLESWNGVADPPLDPLHSALRTPHSPIFSTLYLSLPHRIHARPLPAVHIVDMRQELHQGNRSIFSRSLQMALQALSEAKQQAILFIQRRGHSTFVSCRSCGYVVLCPNCDVSLAYHQVQPDAQPLLRCHYCNYVQLQPKDCPVCQSAYFKHFGSGTQRVVQELTRQFPALRVLRFDSDTTRTKGAHRSLLARFAQGEADVLVGTQMLTKGIDLPQVTLVGIIAADGLLHLSDYRASERAFQTLTQVAGRCGRGDLPGQVILQTYSPDHAVIQAVKQHDYQTFVQAELQHRASLNYPPYGRLILFKLSSMNPVAVQTAANRIAQALQPLQGAGIEQLGPAPATILRVARRYRWQILLKLPMDSSIILPDVAELRSLCPTSISLTIDVDPITLL
jgi:primosomal protein N' (replication factor Y)